MNISEECVCVESRKYVGSGKLIFNSSVAIDCNFEFYFRNDGKSLFESISYLTNGNIQTLLDCIAPQAVIYVSFKGVDVHGGKVEVERIGVNSGSIIAGDMGGIPNPSKYKLDRTKLLKLLSVGSAETQLEIYSNSVFTVRLQFLLVSSLIITYEDISDKEPVTSISELSNFQFGPPTDASDNFTPSIVEFVAKEEGFDITFRRKSNYYKTITQCTFNRNTDTTSESIIETNYGKILQAHSTLSKLCKLISFANSNWIIPIYTDILKNGKTIKSIFYNHKTYNFVNSRYVIDARNLEDRNLIKFLNTSYKLYEDLVRDFRIHMVI